MKHEAIKNKLMMLDDRELSEVDRRGIALHLQGCHECRVRVENLRAAQSVLLKVEPLQASEFFVSQVMNRLAQAEAAREPRFSWALPDWLVPALGYGFAFLLMIAAIEYREVPMNVNANTATMLLADVPQSSQWTFVHGQSPDYEQVMGLIKEEEV